MDAGEHSVMTSMAKMMRMPLVGLLLVLGAAGCSSPPKAEGVAVVGVNYTDFEYSVLVRDPLDATNRGSTGELMPYAGGGQMCCFSLPAQWRPGLQLTLISRKAIVENGRWVRDDETVQTVTLPPYTAGEPGTLWVMQYPEGKVEAISSTLSPAHPQWPGSVKGGPVPSLAHRTKMWKVHYDQAVGYVKLYEDFLASLQSNPDREAQEAWAHAASRRPDELKGFLSPNDPRYRAFLRSRYESSLQESKVRERKLLEEMPK
jgi:Protein of unknown function (DUF3304)